MKCVMMWLVLLKVLVHVTLAVRLTSGCERWEYASGYQFKQCSPCLKCYDRSACSPHQYGITLVEECVKNVPNESYSSCNEIAQCGFEARTAGVPTCPEIASQQKVTLKYLTKAVDLDGFRYNNHMYAEVKISCDDGEEFKIIQCQPAGNWNSSTDIMCVSPTRNQTWPPDRGVTKGTASTGVSPTRNQTWPPDPGVTKGTASNGKASTDHPDATEVLVNSTIKSTELLPNSTSVENVNLDILWKVLIPVCVAAVVGIMALICCNLKKKRVKCQIKTDRETDPEQAGRLLGADVAENGNVLNGTKVCDGHYQNGEICDGHVPNGNACDSHVPNGIACGGHVPNGQMHNGHARTEQESTSNSSAAKSNNRNEPEESSLPVGNESVEMKPLVRAANPTGAPTFGSNLDNGRTKDSIPQKTYFQDQQFMGPCQQNTKENSLDRPASGPRIAEQNDERENISWASNSMNDTENISIRNSTGSSSSQTKIKRIDTSESGQSGSEEGLATKEYMSEANPTRYVDDKEGYYHNEEAPELHLDHPMAMEDPTLPEATQISNDENLSPQISGILSNTQASETGDSVLNEVLDNSSSTVGAASYGASGGPSIESKPRGQNGDSKSGAANSDQDLKPFERDAEGERKCTLRFKDLKDHRNLEEFYPKVQQFTDLVEEVWRILAVNVCGETKYRVLSHKKYRGLNGDKPWGIGGGFIRDLITERTDVPFYRLVYCVAMHPRIVDREGFLTLIRNHFKEHVDVCEACSCHFNVDSENS